MQASGEKSSAGPRGLAAAVGCGVVLLCLTAAWWMLGSVANVPAWARGERVSVEEVRIDQSAVESTGMVTVSATLRNLSGGPLLLSGLDTSCGSAECDGLPAELPFPGRRRLRVVLRVLDPDVLRTGEHYVVFFTSRSGQVSPLTVALKPGNS